MDTLDKKNVFFEQGKASLFLNPTHPKYFFSGKGFDILVRHHVIIIIDDACYNSPLCGGDETTLYYTTRDETRKTRRTFIRVFFFFFFGRVVVVYVGGKSGFKARQRRERERHLAHRSGFSAVVYADKNGGGDLVGAGDTRERREGRVESVSRQLRRVARRETERVCAEISLGSVRFGRGGFGCEC